MANTKTAMVIMLDYRIWRTLDEFLCVLLDATASKEVRQLF
jgi:hypothetical protein